MITLIDTSLGEIRKKMKDLGVAEQNVWAAVKWARRKRT
jgi:hypothetical protein